jgi:hypothetical protein
MVAVVVVELHQEKVYGQSPISRVQIHHSPAFVPQCLYPDSDDRCSRFTRSLKLRPSYKLILNLLHHIIVDRERDEHRLHSIKSVRCACAS